jgi:hypothetical protein
MNECYSGANNGISGTNLACADGQLGANQPQITARDYLETALKPVPGSSPAVEAKNAIRRSIVQLFPDRDCFTLVRPMNDEVALTRMDTLPRDQLRPEFQQVGQ